MIDRLINHTFLIVLIIINCQTHFIRATVHGTMIVRVKSTDINIQPFKKKKKTLLKTYYILQCEINVINACLK
jgi:hypothetical protein